MKSTLIRRSERIQKQKDTNNYQKEAVETWRKHNVEFDRHIEGHWDIGKQCISYLT